MKKITILILLALFISSACYAQEAWHEAAEASAEDYEAPISREIPVEGDVEPAIDEVTNIDIIKPADPVTVKDDVVGLIPNE